jgi:hypothetical protein
MRVSGYGISIDLPKGWEGRIYRRRPANAYPILHAGSFALPQGDGDFGGDAIASMSEGDVFLALLEYDGALAGTGLFNEPTLPLPLRRSDLSPAAFPRRISGRVGVQRFFTEHRRPFCLYAVIGSADVVPPRAAVKEANRILRTVSIERLGAP